MLNLRSFASFYYYVIKVFRKLIVLKQKELHTMGQQGCMISLLPDDLIYMGLKNLFRNKNSAAFRAVVKSRLLLFKDAQFGDFIDPQVFDAI